MGPKRCGVGTGFGCLFSRCIYGRFHEVPGKLSSVTLPLSPVWSGVLCGQQSCCSSLRRCKSGSSQSSSCAMAFIATPPGKNLPSIEDVETQHALQSTRQNTNCVTFTVIRLQTSGSFEDGLQIPAEKRHPSPGLWAKPKPSNPSNLIPQTSKQTSEAP